MTEWLRRKGFAVNCKRVSRLMAVMGIEAVYPKPKLSLPGDFRNNPMHLLSLEEPQPQPF